MMTLEQATELYASVLRQLLPTGGYDTSPNTVVAKDIYAHAKLLAQIDLDAHRLLTVIDSIPEDLINEFEFEYGLPLKCSTNVNRTLAERLEIIRWVRNTQNVFNKTYLEQLLAFFGVELFELKKFKPIQCTASCTAPLNTEQLRYKVRLVIPASAQADMECIIENYLPAYLRVDVLRAPLLFRTSLPYPMYFMEGLRTDLILNDSASRPDPELVSVKIPDVENVGVSMVMHDVIINRPPKIYPQENLAVSMVMHDVVKRELLRHNTLENLSTSMVVHDVISKPRIKTSVDESVGVSLVIHDVIREKI